MTANTALSFHPCTDANHQSVVTTGKAWLAIALQKQNQALDPRMKEIFCAMSLGLQRFLRFVDKEGVSGVQGRQVWLVCQETKIGAMAYGRTFCAGDVCKIFAIYKNPERFPDTMEALNQTAEEGADSVLFRQLVKCDIHHDALEIHMQKLQEQGYKNIIDLPGEGVLIKHTSGSICVLQREELHQKILELEKNQTTSQGERIKS